MHDSGKVVLDVGYVIVHYSNYSHLYNHCQCYISYGTLLAI